MTTLQLALDALTQKPARQNDADRYSRENFHRSSWAWDRVVKGSHPTNCGSGFRPTGLPVGLHLSQQREHL
ncbi:MAG: hypothetical protein U1E51_13950 [Candidatus Binatia bacterium]|nr:hypothetical protein [Candidatus Binatia bacterium]